MKGSKRVKRRAQRGVITKAARIKLRSNISMNHKKASKTTEKLSIQIMVVTIRLKKS
jgi:hypothetical protein